MNRIEKSAVIERLQTALADVPAVVVADFKGLTVEKATELRSVLRKADVHFEVVKNSLARKAVAGTVKENLGELFKGNSAIAYHGEDPTAPAKILTEFVKGVPQITVRGAWLDGKILDEKGVATLATLPGKDELRAKLLSVFGGVPTKFVRTLIAGPTSFVRVLQARADQLAG